MTRHHRSVARWRWVGAGSVLLLTLATAACGSGPKPPTRGPLPPTAAKEQPRTELDELLTQHCAYCHQGGDPKRPPLDGPSMQKDAVLALRAALMIAARNMPPAPEVLDEPTRVRMLRGLCRSAKDAELCFRSVEPVSESPLIMNSDEMLRVLERARAAQPTSASDAPPTPGEEMLDRHDDAVKFWGALAPSLDPTYIAALTLIADERCAKQTGDAYAKCVSEILDQKRYFIPAPNKQARPMEGAATDVPARNTSEAPR